MDGGTGGADGGGGNVSTNSDGSQSVSITATNGLAGSTDGSTGAGFSFLSDALSALDNFSPETNMFGLGLDGVSSAPNSAFSDSSLAPITDEEGNPVARFTTIAKNYALSRALGKLGLGPAVNAYNTFSNFQQGNTQKGLLGLASMAIPGVGQAIGLGQGLAAINSLSQPTSAEGIAAAKSYSGPGANGASTANSGQSMNNILQGLAGLYMGNRYIKNMNNQYNTLSGMYGQDSPYAQTMRQKLERRDAAAGRRSQYGPREVELQAALAGQYGQNAGMMNTLNSNITQARMQQLMMLNKMLGGRQGIQDIFGGLQGLFGGGGGVNDWAQGGQGLEATLGDWGG